ncbi:DUF4192 domain-containing protein [Thermocatellispora tengchongensis]|uniref:DUF4192 domain-containing protein n=1 Tax=Thermocatellispora tengchongensis TaxID=1073253 RepID=UPI003644A8FD
MIRVRDEAWTLMSDATLRTHLALWQDLTRRLEPRFVPPVASLLGLAAWRDGNSAFAGIALRRALAIDPGYSMARLLMHALQHFLSPAALADRMPGPAELDETMGTPRMSWLLPMVGILNEEGPASGDDVPGTAEPARFSPAAPTETPYHSPELGPAGAAP